MKFDPIAAFIIFIVLLNVLSWLARKMRMSQQQQRRQREREEAQGELWKEGGEGRPAPARPGRGGLLDKYLEELRRRMEMEEMEEEVVTKEAALPPPYRREADVKIVRPTVDEEFIAVAQEIPELQKAKKPPVVMKETPSPAAPAEMKRRVWLKDKSDVAAGIVMSEILKPPRALRPYRPPFMDK